MEAAALGNMRGQVAELQHMLSSMGQQLIAEQAMRRNDAQVRCLPGLLWRSLCYAHCPGAWVHAEAALTLRLLCAGL